MMIRIISFLIFLIATVSCGKVTYIGPGGDITEEITQYLAGKDSEQWTVWGIIQYKIKDTSGNYDTTAVDTFLDGSTIYTFLAEKKEGKNYREGFILPPNNQREGFEWDVDARGLNDRNQILYFYFPNPDTSADAYPILEESYQIHRWENHEFSLWETDLDEPLILRERIFKK